VTGFLDLSTSMTLNDLEPPKRSFGEFFAIVACSAHFNTEYTTKWLEIDQDDLHMKFSTLNV